MAAPQCRFHSRLTIAVRALAAWVVRRIEHLRSQHLGSHRIVWMLRIASSSVYRASPGPVPNRCEWPHSDDLLHLDTKEDRLPMGSSAGWRVRSKPEGAKVRLGGMLVHVAVDDRSRLTYVEEDADRSRQRYRRARCAALRRGSLPDRSTGSGD